MERRGEGQASRRGVGVGAQVMLSLPAVGMDKDKAKVGKTFSNLVAAESDKVERILKVLLSEKDELEARFNSLVKSSDKSSLPLPSPSLRPPPPSPLFARAAWGSLSSLFPPSLPPSLLLLTRPGAPQPAVVSLCWCVWGPVCHQACSLCGRCCVAARDR